jgi:hypothetical protein
MIVSHFRVDFDENMLSEGKTILFVLVLFVTCVVADQEGKVQNFTARLVALNIPQHFSYTEDDFIPRFHVLNLGDE